MMMSRLDAALRQRAAQLDNHRAHTRAGVITSVGPDGTTCRVSMHPDGILTGWIPVAQQSVGANAIISPPNVGDFVVIQPHEGDSENWIMTHRLFSTAQPPPQSAVNNANIQPGEMGIITKGGSTIHLTLNGQINIIGQTNIKGDLIVTGKITATGDITAGEGGSSTVTLQNHLHTFVQPGSGNSGPPEAGT